MITVFFPMAIGLNDQAAVSQCRVHLDKVRFLVGKKKTENDDNGNLWNHLIL